MSSYLLFTVLCVSVPSQGLPYHFQTHVGMPGSAHERWIDVFVVDGISATMTTRSEMTERLHLQHGPLVRARCDFVPTNLWPHSGWWSSRADRSAHTLAVCVPPRQNQALLSQLLAPTPPASVLLRMCRNLMNTYTERYKDSPDEVVRLLSLALAIAPEDVHFRRLRALTALSIDMLDVVLDDAARLETDAEGAELLRQARQRDRLRHARSTTRIGRPDDVSGQVTRTEPTSTRISNKPAFHVGMIVRHKRSQWYGVITEWALAHESHRSNNQKRLQLPCYTVAVHMYCDGVNKMRNGIAYVAEHEVERRLRPRQGYPHYTGLVHHAMVGEWFTHYDHENDMYRPNDYVRFRFPDDRVFPPLL
jgi:hypothetical protein